VKTQLTERNCRKRKIEKEKKSSYEKTGMEISRPWVSLYNNLVIKILAGKCPFF